VLFQIKRTDFFVKKKNSAVWIFDDSNEI